LGDTAERRTILARVATLALAAGIWFCPHPEAVTPQACAPILAHALNVSPPARSETPLPPGLFE